VPGHFPLLDPQMFAWPPPPQVCGAVQLPQLMVPPQPSPAWPQLYPRLLHVWAVHIVVPQTFGWLLAPQVSGAVQVPQLRRLPQPSPAEPQSKP